MLFISRHLSCDVFGVYDTDDGTEDEATLARLNEALKHGVDIKGVCPVSNSMYGAFAKPYQNPDTITSLQIKLSTLYGVDTVVFNDMIASITWRDIGRSDPVNIKLSQLGSCMTCFALIRNRVNFGDRHLVTLVLDDHIIPHHGSFYLSGTRKENLGFKIDLRAVKDENNAGWVYRQLFSGGESDMQSLIIDVPERLECMKQKYSPRR